MTELTARQRAQQKYAANNKARISERMKSYRLADLSKFMWKAAKERARRCGMPFEIEPEDIIIPTHCPVFGFPIRMSSGSKGGFFDSASLDKIDPSKGYVKGNIQVVSRKANAMKSDASKEDLIQFAKWILENQDK